MGLALTREVGGAGVSVAEEDGGVGFRKVTVAAGWKAASRKATFSQQAWAEKTYCPGLDLTAPEAPEAPSLASHHGSLLPLDARSFSISGVALSVQSGHGAAPQRGSGPRDPAGVGAGDRQGMGCPPGGAGEQGWEAANDDAPICQEPAECKEVRGTWQPRSAQQSPGAVTGGLPRLFWHVL